MVSKIYQAINHHGKTVGYYKGRLEDIIAYVGVYSSDPFANTVRELKFKEIPANYAALKQNLDRKIEKLETDLADLKKQKRNLVS